MKYFLIFILLFSFFNLMADDNFQTILDKDETLNRSKYSIFYENDMLYITQGKIIRIDTIEYPDSNFVKVRQTYYFDEFTWTDTLIFLKWDIEEFKNQLRNKMKENRKAFELEYKKEINKLYEKLK